MAAVLKDREFVNFDSQDYDCLIEFDNGEQKVSLNAQSVYELSFTESFINWYIEGNIIIDNPYDHFERFGKIEENERLAKSIQPIDYKYRGDGRDIIRIKIMPQIKSRSDNRLNPIELPKEIWEIYFEGVLYDVEELEGETVGKKMKKFYFWEKEYQIMLEKNIEFTTANVGSNQGKTDLHNLPNSERSLKTGEALLEVFKAVEELSQKVPESVGEDWNEGDDKNSILYTSPANYKVIDDINYIMSEHTGTKEDEYDVCFLRFNRRGEEPTKKFSFEALSSYFDKAGVMEAKEYQLEVFTLMDLGETSTKSIPIPKVPRIDDVSVDKNIRVLTRSEVDRYQFVEMGGLDSSELLTFLPVHTYHAAKGQFNIFMYENTPEVAKQYQTDFYVNKIGPKSTSRMQLNNWKKNGYNLRNVMTQNCPKEARYSSGRNKLLLASLMNGPAITFTIRGQTSRQAGRFFSVQREKYNDTDFDDRLEGQYLAITVGHTFLFKEQKYYNNMLGVKLHRYGESRGNIPEDDTTLLE